jgi:hypothetical protein
MDLPALLATLVLLIARRSDVARNPVLSIACSILGVAITGWSTITTHGKRSIEEWKHSTQERILWRGPHGESLHEEVRHGNTTFVLPNGAPVRLINNSAARKPSWRELVDFLGRDDTDEQTYVPNVFVCSSFAERLHNNAEAAGFSCAFVTLEFPGVGGHACNAFETSDRGLVFIDCTNSRLRGTTAGPSNHDCVVNVRDGQPYTPRFLFPSKGWQNEADCMGTARNIRLTW